jgi:hypothetical protein
LDKIGRALTTYRNYSRAAAPGSAIDPRANQALAQIGLYHAPRNLDATITALNDIRGRRIAQVAAAPADEQRIQLYLDNNRQPRRDDEDRRAKREAQFK